MALKTVRTLLLDKINNPVNERDGYSNKNPIYEKTQLSQRMERMPDFNG